MFYDVSLKYHSYFLEFEMKSKVYYLNIFFNGITLMNLAAGTEEIWKYSTKHYN